MARQSGDYSGSSRKRRYGEIWRSRLQESPEMHPWTIRTDRPSQPGARNRVRRNLENTVDPAHGDPVADKLLDAPLCAARCRNPLSAAGGRWGLARHLPGSVESCDWPKSLRPVTLPRQSLPSTWNTLDTYDPNGTRSSDELHRFHRRSGSARIVSGSVLKTRASTPDQLDRKRSRDTTEADSSITRKRPLLAELHTAFSG